MDDDSNTTFEERMNEIGRRENDSDIPRGLSEVTGRPDPVPTFGSPRPDPNPLTGRDPQDAVFGGASADEIDLEELRRDISRLEGKIDALLAALEVEDGDK